MVHLLSSKKRFVLTLHYIREIELQIPFCNNVVSISIKQVFLFKVVAYIRFFVFLSDIKVDFD